MGRTTLKFDTKGLEDMIEKLDKAEKDTEKIVEKALQEAADTITKDTLEAVQKPNLPAGGIYSGGETEASILKNQKVEWNGIAAEVSVGFDYSKNGAGGFLITGSPRRPPAAKLNMIYTGKGYMSRIKKKMIETCNKELEKKLGG